MTYQPWKGTLDDGTEVLVTIQSVDKGQIVEVAFRAKPHHTWGPPVKCEPA